MTFDITVEASVFAQILKRHSAVVPRSASLPVLAGVQLTATEAGELRAVTSDLETSLRSTGATDVTVSGTIVAPARTLTAAVASHTGTVRITDDTGTIHVEGAHGAASMRALPTDEYPIIEWHPDATSTDTGTDLLDRLETILYAAGTNDAKPILMGVHVDGEHAHATDSYRLARTETGGIEVDAGAIIPATAVRFATKHLTGDVTVAVSEREAVFDDGTTRIVTRLIEGAYPKVDALWPTSHDHELTVDAGALVEAVEAVQFAGEQNTPVKLSVDDGTVTVSMGRPDVESTWTIDGTGTLPDGGVGFNPGYLLDAVKPVDGDVTLRLTDSNKPVTVHGATGVDQLVMPIRINQ